jgi:hypothetical protein
MKEREEWPTKEVLLSFKMERKAKGQNLQWPLGAGKGKETG